MGLPSRIEQELQASHLRDQAAIATAFHAAPPDAAHSYIVNTVTPEEGTFLAAYLGVPEHNVLKVKCHGFREANSVHRELRRTLDDYFCARQEEEEELSAITFLGHMELDAQGTFKFANLESRVLFDLIQDLRPRARNFFSCSSVAYATQMGELFAAHGAPLHKLTCFANDIEVSQWPRRGSKHRPLRMFYAGPEIGLYTPTFSPTLHSRVLPWVRELHVPSMSQPESAAGVPEEPASNRQSPRLTPLPKEVSCEERRWAPQPQYHHGADLRQHSRPDDVDRHS